MQMMMSNPRGKNTRNRGHVAEDCIEDQRQKKKYREAVYGLCNEKEGTRRSEYLRWKDVRKIKKELLGYTYAWIKR